MIHADLLLVDSLRLKLLFLLILLLRLLIVIVEEDLELLPFLLRKQFSSVHTSLLCVAHLTSLSYHLLLLQFCLLSPLVQVLKHPTPAVAPEPLCAHTQHFCVASAIVSYHAVLGKLPLKSRIFEVCELRFRGRDAFSRCVKKLLLRCVLLRLFPKKCIV